MIDQRSLQDFIDSIHELEVDIPPHISRKLVHVLSIDLWKHDGIELGAPCAIAGSALAGCGLCKPRED